MPYFFKTLSLTLCLCLIGTQTFAQSLEDQANAHFAQHPHTNIWSLVVENDLFGGGTDSNYTSGVRLSWLDMGATLPSFAHTLAKYIPAFAINNTTSLVYSFGQNLYTSRDITQSTQNPLDRPWAAFLYGSVALVSLTHNHTDEIELTLGVVGPAALGRQTQTFIHRYLSHSPIPRGWDNQLKNEPAIGLGWQRTWLDVAHGDIGQRLGWSFAPYTSLSLGNVHTYAGAGFTLRIGPDDGTWQDTPQRVRPSMPGTGYFDNKDNNFNWYGFAGLETRLIARNIFLDGNTFAHSHSVHKKHIVSDASAGLALTYGPTRISYTAVYRTKEFDTQTKPELFGSITLGLSF